MGNKKLTAILAALLAVAVAVIVFLMASGSGSKQASAMERVPDVVWLKRKEAEKVINNAGLVVGEKTEENSDEIPRGQVISQDPAAGSSVDKGAAVNLVISKGKAKPVMVTVPDLTGMTQEEAEKAISDAQLIAVNGKPAYSDSVEPGKVCSQSVKAGTQVQEHTHVVFCISLGKQTVKVPDVTGKKIDDARDTLKKAGLGTDTTSSYSDSVEKDTVISQSVAKDTQVVEGTVVTLEVSLGAKPKDKVKVPDIYTYTLADAEKALDSAGLAYRYTGDVDGTVVAVSPEVGTEVDQGSTVNFTLRHHASLVAVPDLAGMDGAQASATCQQAGLDLDYDTDNPDKQLSGSDPVAGTMVEVGSTVTATYDPEPTPTPDPVAGGWTVNTKAAARVHDDEAQMFQDAMTAAGKGNATPIAIVASQVVNGTNYAYLGYDGSSWAIFNVNNASDGSVSLVASKAIDLGNIQTTDENPQQLMGGWTILGDETGALSPDEVQSAFETAVSSWTGVSLDPIAYLGSQVVSGTNYKILCAGSAAVADPVEQLYVATVYVDQSGNASFTDVSAFDLTAYTS